MLNSILNLHIHYDPFFLESVNNYKLIRQSATQQNMKIVIKINSKATQLVVMFIRKTKRKVNILKQTSNISMFPELYLFHIEVCLNFFNLSSPFSYEHIDIVV